MSGVKDLMWTHLFEQNRNACWITERTGVIVDANSAALQYASSTIGETSIHEVFVRDQLQVIRAISHAQFETIVKLVNGTGTLHQRGMGEQVFWELQHHTEQMRNQMQLTQLGVLSGGLFHAIRNPLTIVQGRIELLQMLSSDPTLAKELSNNHGAVCSDWTFVGHNPGHYGSKNLKVHSFPCKLFCKGYL